MTLIDRSFREKIVLVGVLAWPRTIDEVEASLDELALLVATAGADVVARMLQRKAAPDPATYIGRGKAEELAQASEVVDADTVVFDDELSPAQQRNLEKILGRTAIDRTAVILDIFAQNAETDAGRAQVELALLQYRLPRLKGRRSGLSQQAGRIGTRGPGETQLEEDRRRITRRIGRLEADLVHLEGTRRTQRRARERGSISEISLVGYTNAGKSTLLNKLTDAGVLVENRLFSTLDPRTRRLALPGGEVVLCSDTVGFVRKLPHQLVEAFHATLEVVGNADLLVHVVDGSARDPEAQMRAVQGVLAEIGANDVPELIAINKVDRSPAGVDRLAAANPGAVRLSALTGAGLDELLRAVSDRLRSSGRTFELSVPIERGDVVAALHRHGEVIAERYEGEKVFVQARLDERRSRHFAEYLCR
ncbi:MAG: GTPase HflX [Acidimicrobiales bacterium]